MQALTYRIHAYNIALLVPKLITHHRQGLIHKDVGPIGLAVTGTLYTSMIPIAGIGADGGLRLDVIKHPADFVL